MPPLESNDEVKEVTGIRILTSNKLLTRRPVFLSQIKAGNKSDKLKNEIVLYLLHQHNKITKTLYNILIKSL